MSRWVDWFARFHADPMGLYVPLGLRSIDCTVTVHPKPSEQPAVPRQMRCIREVAKFNGHSKVEWHVITWVPGLLAMQFEFCESEQAAMARLESPAQPVSFVAMEHAIQGG